VFRDPIGNAGWLVGSIIADDRGTRQTGHESSRDIARPHDAGRLEL
jgi:hypothetical protein